jgi:P-type Cu+ transporter
MQAVEIKEANVSQGELYLKLSQPQFCLSSNFLKINGVNSVELISEDTIKIKFTPEAITARHISYLVEDSLFCKSSFYMPSSNKISLVDVQQKYMKAWLKEFLLSLVFTLPIFCLSMIVSNIVSSGNLTKQDVAQNLPLYNLILWLLATPVQFWFGARFYKGAYKALRQKTANMDLLVAMGTSSAYFYGSIMNIMYLSGYKEMSPMHYIESTHSFETSALLISIILLGKYIESKSKHRTTDAITKLAKLQISSAICIENNTERETDIELLEVGCIVKIYPGASVPVDGVVVEGEAWINESMMTGESSLVRKSEGSFVFGGTVSNKGFINVKVSKVGKDTALSQIISLVESAQSTKPPIQAVADKISAYFVPIVILLAFITWGIWFGLIYSDNSVINNIIEEESDSKFIFGFNFGISVLVIACPCALGLATPTAVMVATGVAAKYGILIKGGDALEGSANIKTIVFDKTGTLTEGKPKVGYFRIFPSAYTEQATYQIIQSVESKSEHSIAKAICNYNPQDPIPCSDFINVEGEGVYAKVVVDNKQMPVYIGNKKLIFTNDIQIDSEILDEYNELEDQGKTVIIAIVDRKPIALIVMVENELVKPEALQVITNLHELNYDVWIITGDNEKSAMKVANYLKIPETRVLANCYPADKKVKVSQLQGYRLKKEMNISASNSSFRSNNTLSILLDDENKNQKFNGVMFVGDGINDSPSLAQADIGIAIGGTDIANESAGVVFLKSDLRDVLITLDLSKKALRKIKWNFFWAFLYNVCGIPLAGGVLFVWTRFQVTSIIAAAAMACSSTAVILSSLMLNKYKPPNFGI